jgi:hypothetical protein
MRRALSVGVFHLPTRQSLFGGMICNFTFMAASAVLGVGEILKLDSRRFYWEVLPQLSSEDRLVVFTACDSKYLEYAIPLVRSLDIFSPGYQFVLHVINPVEGDLPRLRALQDVLRTTRLAISCEQVDLSHFALMSLSAYYASARFIVLPDLQEEIKLPILCLDADSLFVNPIDGCFSEGGEADVVVWSEDMYEDLPDKRKVKNGTIVFDASPKVYAFLLAMRERLLALFLEGQVNWYIDQEVFAQQLLENRYDLNVAHINRAYADWEFSGKSILWAAKGDRKQSDSRYGILMQLLSDRRPDSINIASATAPTPASHAPVGILLPRLDLPWKPGEQEAPISRIKEDVVALRLHWKQFVVLLANALERQGVRVDLYELPAAHITPEYVDSLPHELVFVPHRCALDFEEARTSVLFFMQEYFRWVFVVDAYGWSASSSAYPLEVSSLKPKRRGIFQEYVLKLTAGELGSKFNQVARRSWWSLAIAREIPWGKYVFFPLQIPNDQSIRYFSDFSEEEVVDAVIQWSKQSGVPVVFKPHPVSKKVMVEFEQKVRASGCYWSTANVHDLAAHARAIFTVNSGVGFESLLHLKPVVTFGRAEYDCVTVKATPENIPEAWSACQKLGRENLEQQYSRFVDWFLSSYAIDMSNTMDGYKRLDDIAQSVKKSLYGSV